MTPAEFTRLTAGIAYVPRGMFFSELYLFTMRCLEHGVERIIESGVRNGFSTRVLRALWPGCVQSVELRPLRCPADLQAVIIQGDGRVLLPALVTAHGSTPVGVLLDGPKGSKAIGVRDALFGAHAHVRVVGIHDYPSGHGEAIHTTDPAFRREAAVLDAGIPDAVRALYPLGCPGLGIWVQA